MSLKLSEEDISYSSNREPCYKIKENYEAFPTEGQRSVNSPSNTTMSLALCIDDGPSSSKSVCHVPLPSIYVTSAVYFDPGRQEERECCCAVGLDLYLLSARHRFYGNSIKKHLNMIIDFILKDESEYIGTLFWSKMDRSFCSVQNVPSASFKDQVLGIKGTKNFKGIYFDLCNISEEWIIKDPRFNQYDFNISVYEFGVTVMGALNYYCYKAQSAAYSCKPRQLYSNCVLNRPQNLIRTLGATQMFHSFRADYYHGKPEFFVYDNKTQPVSPENVDCVASYCRNDTKHYHINTLLELGKTRDLFYPRVDPDVSQWKPLSPHFWNQGERDCSTSDQ